MITGDRKFMRSFPHMAAIALGRTTVIAFTAKNYNSMIRGRAMISARARIVRALRNNEAPFIGSVSADGAFNILETKPKPLRLQCNQLDWDSYRRALEAEGVPNGEQE